MNLLNGITLFGRPIKIQFRSGHHASQDVSSSDPQHQAVNSSPTSTSPTRYERTVDNRTPSSWRVQRSRSPPENDQRRAVMNSVLRQMSYGGKFGSVPMDLSGFSSGQSPGQNFHPSSGSQWSHDAHSLQRKVRRSSHPYRADRHQSQQPDYHDRGVREDFLCKDRSPDGWNHDYHNRRDSRDGKWHSSGLQELCNDCLTGSF